MTATTTVIPQGIPPAALVTGAARRIGRTLALALAADGWAVAVHYRGSAEAAAAVVGEIAAGGGRAVALQADLAREDEAKALIPAAVAALGPLGLLVNNAGHFERDTVQSASRASWDAHIEPNLRAPLVLSQAFARQRPATAKGLIVNLLDQRVLKPGPTFISYGVAKAGLWALTQALALALAPDIRVNGIGPGYMLPDAGQSEADFRKWVERQPLRNGGTPAEAVAALRFIIGAPSMTGQIIALDGGQHLA